MQLMIDFDHLREKIARLVQQHQLTEFKFDTECIYNLNDLSLLLTGIVQQTLPEYDIAITAVHQPDEQRYVATLSNGRHSMEVYADDYSDWLPDEFFMQLESIPGVFETGKLYYSINPAIGLTGQDAWYFCGTEANLQAARVAGIPMIFPGESPFDAIT